MVEKMNRIMEHVWLGLAIACLIWIGVEIALNGWESSKQWLPIPFIALSMFAFRRFFRKRMEARAAKNGNKE